jgi:hypothetical protein
MSKRQVEHLVRISIAWCAAVALWTAAALPANAQYAVAAIQRDAQRSDLYADDSRGQSGDVDRVTPRAAHLNATAVSSVPPQPAWLSRSHLKLGLPTQSLSRPPAPVEARGKDRAILVRNWMIHIRPIRDEWDR